MNATSITTCADSFGALLWGEQGLHVLCSVPHPAIRTTLPTVIAGTTNSTTAKVVACKVRLENKGNVRLSNLSTALEGCQPALLKPSEGMDCTVTR